LATDPDTNRPQAIGHTVAEISEKASLLVREEIELAKAEVTRKATSLGKGAVVAVLAGIFAVFGLIYFLHFAAWILAEEIYDSVWLGYLTVAGALFLLAGIAGFVGSRHPLDQEGRAPDAGHGDRGGQADQGDGERLMAAGAQRTPEQIRADIEVHRKELGDAVQRLRGEIQRATDWRSQIVKNQQKVLIGAAVAGFVIGGGIAGVSGLLRRRKR
jgi:hypothetical protein